MIHIFTKKEAPLKKIFGKGTGFSGPEAVKKHSPGGGDLSYLDISGLSAGEVKKLLGQLKKRCGGEPWGIIDPRGGAADPAALFFEGASDYLGAGALKTITPGRLKNAASWRSPGAGKESAARRTPAAKAGAKEKEKPGLPKTGIKVPAAPFPGWKALTPNRVRPFYLLYCSLQGKTSLAGRLGEAASAQLHQRFLALLCRHFQEAEGLIWMDSGKDCLFLLPPKTKNAEAAVKACMRLLISAPLSAIEALGLTVPATFVFTLHYGEVNYLPPGKTGTVVSDAVNSIFHLGAKKAEPGRLTISDGLPDGSVPSSLEDCFLPAGEYEGRRIWHTKKFSYLQNWL